MRRPFLYIAVALSLGIISSRALNIRFSWAFIPALLFLVLAILSSKNRFLSHFGLYLSVFFLGALLYANSTMLPPDHVSHFVSQDERRAVLRGTVADDPVKSVTAYNTEKLTFILDADSIKDGQERQKCSGLVKVDLYTEDKGLAFGDIVVMEGLLSKPRGLKNPGLFDYSRYLEINNIYAVFKVRRAFPVAKAGTAATDPVRKAAYALRHRVREALERYFSQPDSGFLKSILIGDRSALDDSLNEDFIRTGTVHILSISGQHVLFVAIIFLYIFGLLNIPKRASYFVATALLVFYFFLAGSNPPVARSVIMFAVFSFGYILYRESDILNSLSIAALAMLIWNPKELFDVSFQLSFGSVLSIAVLTPKIETLFKIDGKGRRTGLAKARHYILKSAAASAAATAGVAPLVAVYFNIISPVAVLANLIVLPIVFVVMVASFAFLGLNLMWATAAAWFSPALVLADEALFTVNRILSGLPFSSFRVAAPSALFLALYYTALYFLFTHEPESHACEGVPCTIMVQGVDEWLSVQGFAPPKERNPVKKEATAVRRWSFTPKRRKYANLVLLSLAAALVWGENLDPARRLLKVTFIDVGKGDAAFLRFPDGTNLLIDAGAGGWKGRFDAGRSVVAPYLWNSGARRIDALVITHGHADHLGGALYILRNFDVRCVIDNGLFPGAPSGLIGAYKKIIREKKIRHIAVTEGETIKGFKDTEIFILNPLAGRPYADENDNSIVMKLVYKNASFLFCGDIKDEAIARLERYGDFLRSDVLKVPHHGGLVADKFSEKKFFEKISPRVSIISTGLKNTPVQRTDAKADVLTRLKSKSYNTSCDGAIFITSDGRSVDVEK